MKLLLIFIIFIINIYANDINIDNIFNKAKIQNKQVMVFFHMEHCPWCHKMINESLNDVKINNLINKYFIYIDLDVETSGNIIYENELISKRKFARKFNIYFYPTTLMFDNYKIVQDIKGYRNKNKFRNLIKYVGSKSNNNMDIKEFIANEDFNNE